MAEDITIRRRPSDGFHIERSGKTIATIDSSGEAWLVQVHDGPVLKFLDLEKAFGALVTTFMRED